MSNLFEENRKKNEAKNELKDKVLKYLNESHISISEGDKDFLNVLDILGLDVESGKWIRI